ncbi:MAG: cytochrome c oxidase subunit II [Solirubrobacteraceae bacterium]|nr:cytochrome c oxidase subunit II [Solirubrobacteraceae bacterium]
MPLKTLPTGLRKAFAAAAVTVSATLLLADSASASWIAPETGGSPNADSIHSLYMILLVTGLIVFFAVEGLLVYTLWKFKASRGHEAKQIHGDTRLEIGLTAGSALIVIILAIVSFMKLGDIRNPPNSDAAGFPTTKVVADPGTNQKIPKDGKALTIKVTAFQYGFRFTYDDGDPSTQDVYAYRDLYAPTNTTVLLSITSQDVNHAWWIPKLGGKFDAVNGFNNWTWFKVPGDLAGTTFRGQCAELCGRNHANMTASVHALSPSDFAKWLEDKKTQLAESKDAAAKQRQLIDAGKPLG